MDAVENLRTLLTNPLILALPRTTGRYTGETDAIGSQVGFVLLKNEYGTARSIRYWSHARTSAGQKLAPTNKEWLAVVWVVLLLQPYLGLRRFIISKDHGVLSWMLTSADMSGRLARWQFRLLQFAFGVVQRAEIIHQAPHAL